MSDLRDEIAKQLTASEGEAFPSEHMAATVARATYIRQVRWLLEANARLVKAATAVADAAATSIQADAALERVLDTEHEKEAAFDAVGAGRALETAVGEARILLEGKVVR